MGKFIDEVPAKTYKGRFLDEEPEKTVVPDVVPTPKTSLVRSFAVGGAPGFGITPGSEEVLPAVGQSLGQPAGYAGSVAGAALGIGARDVIKGARRGDFKPAIQFGANPGLGFSDPKRLAETGVTAATEGAFRLAGKSIPKVSNRLMNSVLKPGVKTLKRNPNFGLDALEAGITGTRKQMLSKAEGLIDEGETALSSALKNRSGTVDSALIAEELKALKAPFADVGDDASVKAIEEVQSHIASKGKIGLGEANQLKRNLYKVIKENAYGKGVGEISAKQSAWKNVAGGLKRGIEKVAPDVGPINKRIGLGVEASKGLENEIARGGQRVLVPKLASMGVGGLLVSGHPLGALGVAAGDAATEFMRSPQMVSGLAKNILRSKRILKPASALISEGARRLVS